MKTSAGATHARSSKVSSERENRAIAGHSHFIEDIALSQDSRYCLSASWDSTMRLWDLEKFKTTKRFQSHNKDVLTCSFSADNRQISSGGRDHKLKVWNVVGECKYTVDANTHTDWVSAVRYSPDLKTPIAASASWDHTVKVWDSQTMQLKNTFVGHTNAVTTLDFAAAANFLASGGKDNKTCLWNTEKGELLKYKEFSSCVNQVLFSPKKYWLAIATDSGIYIWNLPADEFISKLTAYDGEEEEDPDAIKKRKDIPCTSIAWSKSGTRLYAGFADNKVRIYEVVKV